MSKVTCCKDCTERHYNCHAECERYNKQRQPPHQPNVADAYWFERGRKIEKKILKKGHKYGSGKE